MDVDSFYFSEQGAASGASWAHERLPDEVKATGRYAVACGVLEEALECPGVLAVVSEDLAVLARAALRHMAENPSCCAFRPANWE